MVESKIHSNGSCPSGGCVSHTRTTQAVRAVLCKYTPFTGGCTEAFCASHLQKGFPLAMMVMGRNGQKVGRGGWQSTSQRFEMVFSQILWGILWGNFDDAVLGNPKHKVIP